MSGSGDPDDGRHIDPALGALAGEAAGQAAPRRAAAGAPAPAAAPPAEGESPTYYDRPVIKAPVWKATIAAYFFVGGATGACATLGAAAQVAGGPRLRGLVRRCRWLAAGGTVLSSVLLIDDLGRPGRFLNMLRVVRPSSPMSVGSWVLGLTGAAAAPAAVLARSGGALGRLGDAAGLAAGVGGVPLSGYTAVLLNNTVVPAWEQPRRALAPFFVASGATAASSLLDLLPLDPVEDRVVRRFGLPARAADLAAGRAVEREAGARVARVARPYRQGVSGVLWRAATGLTAASLGLSLLPRSRRTRALAGLCGAAGSLAARYAVFHAGRASAADPRATFELQRASRTEG